MLDIDGSDGEGGGQILRSALSLAICTQQPFRIANIRANRDKPGLLRQHLTAVTAAAQICDAEVDGATLGSRSLVFRPNRAIAGRYRPNYAERFGVSDAADGGIASRGFYRNGRSHL